MVRLGTFSELPTKNAARNKLAEILSSSATEKVEMSFLELTDRWKTAEGPTLKTTTFSHYTNALRAYVLPVFGIRKIASINREDIQTFLAEKAKTYSTSTLRSMRAVLGLTLGWANACGWIPKNPCVKVRLPKNAGGQTSHSHSASTRADNRYRQQIRGALCNSRPVPGDYGSANWRGNRSKVG